MIYEEVYKTTFGHLLSGWRQRIYSTLGPDIHKRVIIGQSNLDVPPDPRYHHMSLSKGASSVSTFSHFLAFW